MANIKDLLIKFEIQVIDFKSTYKNESDDG